MDRVVFTCDQNNFAACLSLAREHRAGLEIQSFAFPHVLDGNWRELVDTYNKQLNGFEGDLACHGAFYDLASGSPDRRVQALARERYEHNLNIARELGAHTVIFHANFLPQVNSATYRALWSELQTHFWGELAEDARALDVTIVLENMWEPDPMLIGGVIDGVGSQHLKACLDVGHVYLYSPLSFDDWLDALNSRLAYVHMNNNSGIADDHRALDDGIIDYHHVLPALRAHVPRPLFSLEIDNIPAIEKSLSYLDLP